MSWNIVSVVMAAGLLLVTTAAEGTVPVGSCEVVECSDGSVMCSPLVEPGETQGEGGGKFAVKCMSHVVDAPCSEVPACGRRVPVIGVRGLALLGLAMAAAGALFLRRRQTRVRQHTS